MSQEAKTSVYKACESFDQTYSGFSSGDFMNAVITLTAWHTQGRQPGLSSSDKVKAMIEEGYSGSRANIDRIRNEIEVSRLALLSER